MARRRLKSEVERQRDQLVRLVAEHASRAARRGSLLQCSCDLCAAAHRKLEKLRASGGG